MEAFLRLPFSFAESEAPFAEGEGFKPPIPEKGIPDFESSAIDHSANLPIKREPTSITQLAEKLKAITKRNLPFLKLRVQSYNIFVNPPNVFGKISEKI